VVVVIAIALIATAASWVALPAASGSERVAQLLTQFPQSTTSTSTSARTASTDTSTNYGLVIWSRPDGHSLSVDDRGAVASRIADLAPLAVEPDLVRANLAVNRKAILIELPLAEKQEPTSAARNHPVATIIRSRAAAELPDDLIVQVTGTVTATGTPAVSYPPASIAAQRTIDADYGTGYGNRAVMLVPQSLAGETSTIAPTTLAMTFDTVHSVTREATHAGRSELIVAINADPGSTSALATVRGIRTSLASTGGPTARTLVGGTDAMLIDHASAVAAARLIILCIAIGLLVVAAVILTILGRRRGPRSAQN
jgi:hypothetical protein